jgi:hypothetical protein
MLISSEACWCNPWTRSSGRAFASGDMLGGTGSNSPSQNRERITQPSAVSYMRWSVWPTQISRSTGAARQQRHDVNGGLCGV